MSGYLRCPANNAEALNFLVESPLRFDDLDKMASINVSLELDPLAT